MPYEFRIIKEISKVVKNYDQLDIYFFKPKLARVGIKVRFDGERRQYWHADQLELKFIKNLKEIEQGLAVHEDWKKVRMPIDLKIHTKKNIASKLHPTELAQITLPVKKELMRINYEICKALEKQKISDKHYKANQDLKRWISNEHPLAEVFIVEKLKYKSFSFEQGDFRVSALYGQGIKETTWETICVESSNEQSLKQKIAEYVKGTEANTSYPGLLQKIYNK